MKTTTTVFEWRCYCGRLNRIKHHGCRCLVCRTECLLAQPSELSRVHEMAAWLAQDYRHLGTRSAVWLTAHTARLVRIMKDLNAPEQPKETK